MIKHVNSNQADESMTKQICTITQIYKLWDICFYLCKLKPHYRFYSWWKVRVISAIYPREKYPGVDNVLWDEETEGEQADDVELDGDLGGLQELWCPGTAEEMALCGNHLASYLVNRTRYWGYPRAGRFTNGVTVLANLLATPKVWIDTAMVTVEQMTIGIVVQKKFVDLKWPQRKRYSREQRR